MTDFEFGVLGPLEVLVNGSPVTVSAGKQRVVLAALLTEANRVVSVDRLVELVWGDESPANARNALQTYVLRLRKLLGGSAGSGPVVTRPPGYVLEVASEALDLSRFTDLVRRGRAAVGAEDSRRGADLLRRGLSLWRGEPLSDVPSEVLRRAVVPALRGTVARCGGAAGGRGPDARPARRGPSELQELTARYPLQEQLWAQQMRALYLSGRQAEALDCYRIVGELLADQLGVDPGKELREVHRQVLTGDPALTPPAAPSAEPSPHGSHLVGQDEVRPMNAVSTWVLPFVVTVGRST